jgi:hypothetical protein
LQRNQFGPLVLSLGVSRLKKVGLQVWMPKGDGAVPAIVRGLSLCAGAAAVHNLRRLNWSKPVIRIFVPAAVLVLAALPALAQPTNMTPTRDVTVTYRMTGMAGVPPQETRMAFSPTTGKQRVDPPGGVGWMLIDRKANSAVMVMDAQRMTMAMPPATVAAVTQGVPAGATFIRKGNATVAGTACTEWDMTAGGGQGTSCFTDDGVLLRTVTTAPNGVSVTMEATQVTYGPIASAQMSVPSGYTAMQMPAGSPTAPGATPGR